MTDQQMKMYVDNVFEKYDKDRSFTLDLQQLSQFLNDLLLSRGSIALPSLQQVKNSMRALNPQGGDGMTKQTLYNTLQRLNGNVDDIVVAILETMNHQEEPVVRNPHMKMTSSYMQTPGKKRDLSPRPQPKTLAPMTPMSNVNQLNINQGYTNPTQYQQPQLQTQQSAGNLYNVPQQYRPQQQNQLLAARSTPTPVVTPRNQYQSQNQIGKSVPIPNPNHAQNQMYQQQAQMNQMYAQQQQQGYGNYYQPNYAVSQPQGNYAQQTGAYSGYQAPMYAPQYSQQPAYNQPTYNHQSMYSQPSMSMGGMGGMGDYGMGGGGAPAPPFNPLAALSFF